MSTEMPEPKAQSPKSLVSPWVVIPTYNEIDNVEAMIRALFALAIPNLTVLIVDDSSPDGTGAAVKDLQTNFSRLQLLVRQEKAGLGRAYVAGFRYAIGHGATAVVQMDADFSHSPEDVPKLLAALTDCDLALGSRYSHGISVINWPLRRLIISIAGNVYARVITGTPFKDITGGFKAWRADTLRDIDLPTVPGSGYGFQIATTFRAWKAEKNITEVPIVFTERREGQSKMTGAIIREAIWLVWKLRLFGS